MANQDRRTKEGSANETNATEGGDGSKSYPANWGAFKGNRVNITVFHGKVWLHVHRDGQRISLPMYADQVEPFIENLRIAKDAAFLEREEFRMRASERVAQEAA